MYNYIINFKNSQFYNKILYFLVFLLLFSFFFPVRHVFLSADAYLTGRYSDFTSFSLYLSDILIFTTWFFLILPRGREFYGVVERIKWLILGIFFAFLLNAGLNTKLNAYFLIKWLELIVAYGTFVVIFKQNSLKTLFISGFTWFCSGQSIISLIQFTHQSSLGLFRLGESHLSPSILGVAKIVSGGTRYIRGYGTFPHPNPFSAFLLTGILFTLYLLIMSKTIKYKVIYSILLFVNILGLTTTFSRGAYLALAFGLIMFFSLLFFLGQSQPQTLRKYLTTPVLVSIISILISFVIFSPFVLTRATFSDQSTIDRKFYDKIGIKMILKNPLFGVGLGESLLHMEQYSGKNLAPWEKQPPHNYFIIAAAEMGIPAMLVLVWIFLSHLWELIKNLKLKIENSDATYYLLLATILCSFFILMQFDHYFYTLEQTQLLLWVILALIAAQTSP